MTERYDKLDCLLFIAVEGCGMDEVEAFENLDISDVPTSSKYIRKKKRVITKYKMKPRLFTLKRFVRVAVTVLLVVFSAAFITVMSVSALRNAVLDVIVDWFEDFVKVEFHEDGVDKSNKDLVIEDVKHITALPEGVEKEIFAEYDKSVMITYYLSGKRICTLRQEIYCSNEAFFDNVGLDMQEVYINDIKGYLFVTENGVSRVYWNDGEYTYMITLYDSRYDIISIAGSVK